MSCSTTQHNDSAGSETPKPTFPIAQLVASQIADPGVVSSIMAWSHTFLEIDHEIVSMVILFLPLIQEGLVSVTNASMYTKY